MTQEKSLTYLVRYYDTTQFPQEIANLVDNLIEYDCFNWRVWYIWKLKPDPEVFINLYGKEAYDTHTKVSGWLYANGATENDEYVVFSSID
jgi:hypothetical protein